MKSRHYSKLIPILLGLLTMSFSPIWAGNGNMLHGFGPVNSSMGGAGAGLWVDDPVGALAFNPALISEGEGTFITFGTEFFEDGVEIKATLNDGTTGVTNPSNQLGVLPAFAFSHKAENSKVAIGFGLIAIAGFRTDYPEDPSSILFARQPFGFGRIYTDHRVTKIPLAISYDVNDKLSVGMAFNVYKSELTIAPLPYRVRDIANGTLFYPEGDGLDLEFAYSIQPSFLYRVNDSLSIGGSLTTEQDYNTFTWNSRNSNPNSKNFGAHRLLNFDLDGPMIATLGAGYRLNDRTRLALDASWIEYSGVSGFGSPGGIVDGVVQPFGWDDVWAFKLGAEHDLYDKLTLRAGYNYSTIPLPAKNTLTATGAPSYFQHHFSVGLGYQVSDSLTANVGFYYVPRSGKTGPFLNPNGPPIGKVEESNTLTSVQLGLTWQFDNFLEKSARRGGKNPILSGKSSISSAPSYQAPDLQDENAALRKRIAELEAQLEN
ncbi:MAG: long-chain fatty acid transport protein [Verrucomicrobiales bacterium]|jgi:long-chain fatty acid transport protein